MILWEVSAHLINRWRRELEAINDSTLTEDDVAELKRLRKENKRLRLEQEILKKASAFFAQHLK